MQALRLHRLALGAGGCSRAARSSCAATATAAPLRAPRLATRAGALGLSPRRSGVVCAKKQCAAAVRAPRGPPAAPAAPPLTRRGAAHPRRRSAHAAAEKVAKVAEEEADAADSDEEEEARGGAAEEEEEEDGDEAYEENNFMARVLSEAAQAAREARSAAVVTRAPSSEWSAPTERARWSKVKKALRPTQAALVRAAAPRRARHVTAR
jgi:hypothetical protein